MLDLPNLLKDRLPNGREPNGKNPMRKEIKHAVKCAFHSKEN